MRASSSRTRTSGMLAECLLTAPQIAGDLEWGLNGKDRVLSVWAVATRTCAERDVGANHSGNCGQARSGGQLAAWLPADHQLRALPDPDEQEKQFLVRGVLGVVEQHEGITPRIAAYQLERHHDDVAVSLMTLATRGWSFGPTTEIAKRKTEAEAPV